MSDSSDDPLVQALHAAVGDGPPKLRSTRRGRPAKEKKAEAAVKQVRQRLAFFLCSPSDLTFHSDCGGGAVYDI